LSHELTFEKDASKSTTKGEIQESLSVEITAFIDSFHINFINSSDLFHFESSIISVIL
jgi:hypothetical protein